MATKNAIEAAAAASSSTSDVGNALNYVSALGIAPKITTVIALAALAIIAAFLLARQWQSSRRSAIDKAIVAGDDELLGTYLGNSNIDLGNLTKEQKFSIAASEVKQRFVVRLTTYALAFLGFIALLIFAVLAFGSKPAEAKVIDPLDMAALLKFVPEDQRQIRCEKTLDTATCKRIVDTISGIAAAPYSERVQEEVSNALDKGVIAPKLAVALKRVDVVSVGLPQGWDVDFFWCQGPNEAANKSQAEAAAAALGRTSGERIAPGISLGRIRVRAFGGNSNGAIPEAGTGSFVLSDSSSGKVEAANAIVATLAGRGHSGYTVRPSEQPARWYIKVYDCRARRIMPVDRATSIERATGQ